MILPRANSLLALCAMALSIPSGFAFAADSLLAGTWRIDLARGTELSPWKSFDLIIAIDGTRVSITPKLAWGRRDFTEAIAIDTTKSENIVPIEWWADNRPLGAY